MFTFALFDHTYDMNIVHDRKDEVHEYDARYQLWFLVSLCLVCMLIGGLLFGRRGGSSRY